VAREIRYARNGDVNLAWVELGQGPIDILFLLGGVSHVEHVWEEPGLSRYFERIAQFARVLLMDRRGVGLSDPVEGAITLDDECGDVDAVLDAAGSDRVVLNGHLWGGPLAIHYAHERPARVRALTLYAAVPTALTWTEDIDREREPGEIDETLIGWGTGQPIELLAPSRADDERLRAWLGRLTRLSTSPGAMRNLWRSTSTYDARADLEDLRVPTLILHRSGDRAADVRHSRYMAERIPGARYVELEGIDNLPSVGDTDAIVAELEEFLTGTRRRSIERALLTVLVTDIVDSTGHAARLGDQRWRDVLAAHDREVRQQIDRFDGREVKHLGDGFLIAFAGAPSLAHRCALAILEAVEGMGIELRAGLHTGECELIGDDVGGMAVHIATRVGALAGPGEVFASGTAYGTVVGSGLRFDFRGSHELRGVPGQWPIMRLLG
jgi:pimeloyl-ACP methyl ester carboxylesterase